MTRDWSERGERGSLAWLLFVRWLALTLGRRTARLALYPAVAWYLVRAREEQRHVRDFLRRVLPRAPRFRDVAHTYWSFAAVTLDRVFLLAGRDSALDVRVHGAEPLLALHRDDRGALLLGAHLGSFEAMRALGLRRQGLSIGILQYTEQNPQITRVLGALDPELASAVIPLGSPDVLVRLAHYVERGGFVALLADRVAPGDTHYMRCRFFGGEAHFATGGAEAALILGCPVFFFAGLYAGGNHYDLHFELLAEGHRAPRRERRAEARRITARYAACLERYARRAPYNWFNMYPYWGA